MKYHGKPSEYFMTHEEIAKALGISRAQVQVIERNALKKIRAYGKLQRIHWFKGEVTMAKESWEYWHDDYYDQLESGQ